MHVKQIVPLAYPAEWVLSAYITKVNPKSKLNPANLVFGEPAPQPGEATAVSTTISAVGTLQAPPPTGSVSVLYNRTDLGTYFEGVNPFINTMYGTSDQAVLDALMDAYQLYFTTVNTDPTDTYSRCEVAMNTSGPSPSLTITADPANLIWQGTVTFNLQGGWVLLAMLPEATIEQLVPLAPPLQEGQDYAEDRYGTNFNVQTAAAALGDLSDGPIPTQSDGSPWALGAEITGDPWIYDASQPAPFNIAGAQVLYTGPAQDIWTVSPNPNNYTNVVVIVLGPMCSNLAGALIIPFTPLQTVSV
jgi:hypothetical protein